MGTLISYRLENSVATIAMDDGKVNALSLQMLTELNAALDRAAADRAVVVLTGRPGCSPPDSICRCSGPAAPRRSPCSGRASSYRADDSACRCRDLPATARAVAPGQGRRPRGG